MSIPENQRELPDEWAGPTIRSNEPTAEHPTPPPTVEERFEQWREARGIKFPIAPKDRTGFRDRLRNFLREDVTPFVRYSDLVIRGIIRSTDSGRPTPSRVFIPSSLVYTQLQRLTTLYQAVDGNVFMNQDLAKQQAVYESVADPANGHEEFFPEIRGVSLLREHFAATGQEQASAAAYELLLAYGASVHELHHNGQRSGTRRA